MPQAILIYDTRCAYCRAYASFIKALDIRKKLHFTGIHTEEARRLLNAQFGKRQRFALHLFEKDTVSTGKDAVQGCFRNLKIPSLKLYALYPAIARAVSYSAGHGMPKISGTEKTTAATKALLQKIFKP
ncbi:DUF393 domain-containing protein [Candidatus Woesearchaeota archaeon]|nr:DUF393 domain-containing protein [Candidatus Woesearchaeota archaeon]